MREAAGTRTRKLSPTKSSPIENFAGLDGSRLPSLIHNHAKKGAKINTNSGWTHWNQLAGNSYPNTCRLVFRSAKRFSDDPACSYAPQNTADAINKTKTAAARLRSCVDQPLPKIIHEKTMSE